MTKKQYLIMCESMGEKPDLSIFPTDIDDFPPLVGLALELYNNLSDNYIPGELPMYVGKDKSSLNVLFDIYQITDPIEKEYILHFINIFDSKAVEVSKNRMKKAGR